MRRRLPPLSLSLYREQEAGEDEKDPSCHLRHPVHTIQNHLWTQVIVNPRQRGETRDPEDCCAEGQGRAGDESDIVNIMRAELLH